MKGLMWLLAGIAVIVTAGLVIPPPADRECDSKKRAYEEAIEEVESNLRSPSTAKWQSRNNAVIVSQEDVECGYQVFAHVDAQNGYGAMIRQEFVVEVQFLKDKMIWVSRNISM